MPLPSLTGLRGVAALLVVGYHCVFLARATGWIAPGTAAWFGGVSFFFVLSGFVLTWSLREQPARDFYVRRLRSIRRRLLQRREVDVTRTTPRPLASWRLPG